MKRLVIFLSIILIGYGSYYYYYETPKDMKSSELKQIDFKFTISENGKLLNGSLFNNTNRTITDITMSSYNSMFADLYPITANNFRYYDIKVHIPPHHLGHFKVVLFDENVSPLGFKIVSGESLP